VSEIILSIVTPCYNEEETVEKCVLAVRRIMSSKFPNMEYEHIFSDNSSTDKTLEVLKSLATNDSRLKIVVNSRNIGASRNIYRALRHTSGRTVVPMLPADLQDPAEVIPLLVAEHEKGNKIVYGVRSSRKESLVMRILRSIYYKIIWKLSGSRIPINSGEFMLLDRIVVDSILSTKDANPYVRGLVAQTGFKSSSVSYTWVKREGGKSKSSFFVLIDTAINGLVSTSRLPARIALLFGFFFATLGLIFGIASALIILTSGSDSPQGIPTIIIAIFTLGGIQLFFLGLIGEYVLSIHGQVRPEPDSVDVERINF
jgi:glycosyltransferase involved in cell wall biosynthesis